MIIIKFCTHKKVDQMQKSMEKQQKNKTKKQCSS